MKTLQIISASQSWLGRKSYATLCFVAMQAVLPMSAVASEDMTRLIAACSEGTLELDVRALAIKELGFEETKSDSPLWVQAQVAHIAMSDLEQGGTDIRETYEVFAKSAEIGELFATDIEQYSFSNNAQTVEISLSNGGGPPGCSIAYSINAAAPQIPLPVLEQWASNAGRYVDYKISQDRFVTQSVLSPLWDDWIKGKRLASGFLVITQ